MTILKRAFLYISRKKTRSIILIILLCVLIVFMLVGSFIAMQASAQAEELKSDFACGFTVETNFDARTDSSLQEAIWDEKGEHVIGVRYLTPVEINDELIDKIASVDEIDSYNVQTIHFAYTPFEIKEGRETLLIADMEKYPPEMKEDLGTEKDIKMIRIMANYVNVYGNIQSDLHQFFQNGAFSLTEGRHITEKDEYAVVISRQMAERNNVSVGDMMPFEISEEEIELIYSHLDTVPSYFECEIVGIYDINFAFDQSEYTWVKDIPENYVFMDITGAKTSMFAYANSIKYERVNFYVDDPEKLDSTIAAVKEVDLPWAYLKIVRDDTAYQSLTAPLESLTGFSSLLLFLSAVTCFLLLFLIMNLLMRSRTKEIYIMRSLGISKIEIFKQQLLELLIISAIAFVAGIIITVINTSAVGETFEKLILPEVPASDAYVLEYDIHMNGVIQPAVQSDVDITYTISPAAYLIVGGITFASAFISVYFASKKLLNKPLCDIKNNIK